MKTSITKSKINSFVVFFCFFILAPSLSISQTWDEVIKLSASDAFGGADNFEGGDEFGNPVFISGNRAIVGALKNDDDGFSSGAAYIFELVGETWIEIQKLTASDASGGDRFGESVAIYGDRAIVSAIYNEDDGERSGCAYIFELVDDTWIETQKLTASDASENDYFGSSVSILGEIALVGAPRNDDGGGISSGSVYSFELVAGTWEETQKLSASDAALGNSFGSSISLSDNRAIIGALRNIDGGDLSGAAYIFELIDDIWVETQKLTASDADEFDYFGESVAISGDRVIIGASRNDDGGYNSGSAYIFELIADTWVETQKLTASDADASDKFGISVSISGERAIVGAPLNEYSDISSGTAYIFELEEETWVETQILTSTDAEFGDVFGNSVSISGIKAIIGAKWNDDAGIKSGSAYIFETCLISPTVIANADDTLVCEGDLVTLNGEGAVTYTWDGGIVDSSPFIPPVGTTTYNVIGRDEMGCGNTASIDITVLEAIEITYDITHELLDDDASIDITVTGGSTDYSFDWDTDGTGDFDDEEDLIDITNGTYVVVVKDDEGCTGTATITVVNHLGTNESHLNIAVYPIPTSNQVTIELEGEFICSLVSLNGKILSETKAVKITTIDLSKFAKGIYFVEIRSVNGTEIMKLVKE